MALVGEDIKHSEILRMGGKFYCHYLNVVLTAEAHLTVDFH